MVKLHTSRVSNALITIARGQGPSTLTGDDQAALEEFLRSQAHATGFAAYGLRRNSLELATGTAIAEKLLTAKINGHDIAEAIGMRCDPGADAIELASEIASHSDFDHLTRVEGAELLSYLADRLEDLLLELDTSEPSDAFGRGDEAELLFVFCREDCLEDGMIYSRRPWADYSDLVVDDNLAHGLGCLGFTVSEYRAHSRNRTPSQTGRQRSLSPLGFKRPAPLCPADKLQEIVENACSSTFLFAVYGVVPLSDLMDLDLAQPITFERAAYATYNPYSGTFHDGGHAENVTVRPEMGQLLAPASCYSPDSICGLSLRHYRTRLIQGSPAPFLKAA